jgi:hypothetical protein
MKIGDATRHAALTVVIWAAGATAFFHHFIFSGGNWINSDDGDGRFLVFSHEHLFQAIRGTERFLSPPMMFPKTHILGYSDALLLNTLVYVPLRWLGLDPYLSTELTYIALSLLGFAAFWRILTRFGGVRPSLALAGALLFTFPNQLALLIHGQLFAVYYCPLIILLGLEGAAAFESRRRRAVVLLFAAGLVDALLFATSYYIAWFFNAFLATAMAIGIVARWRLVRVVVKGRQTATAQALAIALSGFLLGLYPFLKIYLPVIAEFPAKAFRDYLDFAPPPLDFLQLTGSNLVWGCWLGKLFGFSAILDRTGEFGYGPTPLVIALFLVAMLAAGWRWRAVEGKILFGAMVGTAIAYALFYGTIIKVDGHSLFRYVAALVPGAGAIRVGGRAFIIVNGFVVAFLAIAAQRFASGRRRTWLVWGLAALCLTEQVNLASSSFISRAAQRRWFAAIPPPPAACKFFHTAWRGAERNLGNQQMDAVLAAQRLGLPTLNGYSGNFPVGWGLIQAEPGAYDANLRHWKALNGLARGDCDYDFRRHAWTVLANDDDPAPPAPPSEQRIVLADPAADRFIGAGWYGRESFGRWTSGPTADLVIPRPDRDFATVTVVLAAYLPRLSASQRIAVGINQCADVALSGRDADADFPVDQGVAFLSARIPPECLAGAGPIRVTLTTDQVGRPIDFVGGHDARVLGLAVREITLD